MILTKSLILNKWWHSSFPEDSFPCYSNEYISTVLKGLDIMSNSSVLLCGLARNVENVLPYTILRVNRLGKMFSKHSIFVYENDSIDCTKNLLKWWECTSNNVIIKSENLGTTHHDNIISLERTTDMAYYRNKYLDFAKQFECDYVIVFDSDLEGGWSYEGIAHSIGLNMPVVGSNGILYREKEKLYYDSYAWRFLNDDSVHTEKINLLKFNRGEQLVEVNSCFGGLAIYKKEVLNNVSYHSYDCDHPTLHKEIRKNGYKIYMNPSQICLYSPTRYCKHVDW